MQAEEDPAGCKDAEDMLALKCPPCVGMTSLPKKQDLCRTSLCWATYEHNYSAFTQCSTLISASHYPQQRCLDSGWCHGCGF